MSTSQQERIFVLSLEVPRVVSVAGATLEREAFFEWLWSEFSEGLVGIHEGTMLSEEAAEIGLETESYTVDAAEAPKNRDWVAGQGTLSAELYFSGRERADEACERLQDLAREAQGLVIAGIKEQEDRDWDAEWKASFLNNGEGVVLPPFWRIVPPWVEKKPSQESERWIRINPGAGFGTGTHETTQLCLQAIGERMVTLAGQTLSGRRVLDFGSGSGILAIGAALLGAQVDAVEIDPLAVENAQENARINGVESPIRYSLELAAEILPYEIVLANILKPVLLQFRDALCARVKTDGALILSGLVENDVAEILASYGTQFRGVTPRVLAKNEWRAIVFAR